MYTKHSNNGHPWKICEDGNRDREKEGMENFSSS